MKRVFSCDIKRVLHSPMLLISILILAAAGCFSAWTYIQQLMKIGSSTGASAFFEAFQYGATSSAFLILTPLICPLIFAVSVEEEFHTRFVMLSCLRAGRRTYILGKIGMTILTGGLITLLGAMLFALGSGILLVNAPLGSTITGHGYLLAFGSILLCCFLNGGLWALVAGMSALITRNCYMAYAVPFILYYVLTIFQERYYKTLYFLSPRQWGAPMMISKGAAILILLILLFLLGAVYGVVMNRRIEHV